MVVTQRQVAYDLIQGEKMNCEDPALNNAMVIPQLES